MKSFKELKKEIQLIEYLPSEFGTMYFEPNLPRENKKMIRHLDSKLSQELLPIYVHLYHAIEQWIETNLKLNEHVFMPALIEVGKDYIIRPFYAYDVDTRDYVDIDEPVDPPELYEKMKEVAKNELPHSDENIIHHILAKSLLEPSGKTYYNHRMNKFIIVEPKISLADLDAWRAIHPYEF